MNVISKIIRQVPHFWRSVTFGTLSALASICLLATSAFLISSASLQPAILTLNAVVVSVRAFAFARAGFRYAERLDGHDGAFRMMKQLRVAVYERIVPLAPARLGTHSRADVVHSLIEDVDAQQDAVVRVREPLWISAATVVVAIAGIWVISSTAALVLLVAIVVVGILGAWLPAKLHGAALANTATAEAKLDTRVDDAVTTLRMQLAYGTRGEHTRRVGQAQQELASSERSSTAAGAMTNAVILAVLGSAMLIILVIAARDAAWGAFAGTFVAVLVLVPLALIESTGLAATAMQHQIRVAASRERLVKLVADAEPITQAEDVAATHLARAPKIVEVADGAIGWSGADLTGISLSLMQGTTTLIRGASGRGKSTLAATLCGLIPAQGGTWKLAGVDMATLDSATIRANCVLVEQRAHLFSGPVRQNLLLAHPEATDDQLWQVIKDVGLDADLALREGLDTEVGELGERLSGGQVQRLALARAMLVAAPVIVLDEPTASVDPEQSAEVTRALLASARSAKHNPAIVILTHEQVPDDLIDQYYDLDQVLRASR